MPIFDTSIDISIPEILDECDSFEIEDCINWLLDNNHLNELIDEEVEKKLLIIKQSEEKLVETNTNCTTYNEQQLEELLNNIWKYKNIILPSQVEDLRKYANENNLI